MASPIEFEILSRCGSTRARTGRVRTPHGSFETPAFMPVGTRAAMKGLTPAQTRATGTEIIVNNAYHLMLRPGEHLIRRLGGVQRFMRWDGPILTDSGGYQVYSMSSIRRIDDDGVVFRSYIDGAEVHLGPERSIEVQNALGADVIMAFDDCPPSADPARAEEIGRRFGHAPASELDAPADHRERLRAACDRTARWLERCVAAHARPDEQALFGIVQGGTDHDLRARSVEQVCSIDLPGYAIGGVAVGEGPDLIRDVTEFTAPRLPEAKPRYLMGVGYEQDIVVAVRAGVDMFDCVLPTRNGRNGHAFTTSGRIQVRNARFAEDDGPLDESCDCEACTAGLSRAYLRHLFMSKEMLGPVLVSLHNIRHFQRLLLDIRTCVRENDWTLLAGSWPVLEPAADRSEGWMAGRD